MGWLLEKTVSCVQRRVVEGSGVGSAGCIAYVDGIGSELCCGWLQCTCSCIVLSINIGVLENH